MLDFPSHIQTFRSITELTPFANNSRLHSDEQIEQVVKSIQQWGFTNPILIDENNTIIAGHCRVRAAQKVGLLDLPCVELKGLTDSQKRAYVIADNKLALNASWDIDLLRDEFEALKTDDFNLELTGFSIDELCTILHQEIEGLCDEDACPEVSEEAITKPGDLWILGDHRLLCGDSTVSTDVERLLGQEAMDLIFTDPPYNVAFNGRSGKFEVIKNDKLSDSDFTQFISSIVSIIHLLKCPYYIWCNWKFYSLLQTNLEFTACIVWAKNNFGMGIGYRHQHEFCLTNAKIDSDIKNESDLWSVSKDTNYEHPTQKPIALAERALINHSKAKHVIDLFGGSGSTLIACEKLKRKCFMMELDPKYCDVIIKRYEMYSGKKVVLCDA